MWSARPRSTGSGSWPWRPSTGGRAPGLPPGGRGHGPAPRGGGAPGAPRPPGSGGEGEEAFLAPVPLRPRAPRVEVQAKALGQGAGSPGGGGCWGPPPQARGPLPQAPGVVRGRGGRQASRGVREGGAPPLRALRGGRGVLVDPRFAPGLEDSMELLPSSGASTAGGRELASLLEV